MFFLPFHFLDLFISFSFLHLFFFTMLASISNKALNNSSNLEHLCFGLNLEEKAFNALPLTIVFARGFLWIYLTRLRMFIFFPFQYILSGIHVEFYQVLFLHIFF